MLDSECEPPEPPRSDQRSGPAGASNPSNDTRFPAPRSTQILTGPQLPHPSSPPIQPMEPAATSSPALSVAIAVLAVLLGLTGFGIYTAFGPPSKRLTDPFDDHED